MNILIADSGSTKTEWALVSDSSTDRMITSGINPVHMPAGEIREILLSEFHWPTTGIEAVYFYGAGCIPEKCTGMETVLQEFFGIREAIVCSDLLGAARGLLGNTPGIACILGTGSNSAAYDGKAITKNIPPLGYVLGDEGSGADLGKRLIGNLLKGLLPDELTSLFYKEYPLEYAEIIEYVYRKPGANRFLAQFTPFIRRYASHPEVAKISKQAFVDFTERNLMLYEGIREFKVSFTGSIAFYFANELRDVLAGYGLSVDKIEQSPMSGLIEYHTQESRHKKR